MAKGYWVARVDVTDPTGYQKYVAANAAAFRKYGARFIVRGGQSEAPEGRPAPATSCWNSPTTRPRWPAIAPPNTRPPRRCATAAARPT